MEEIKTIPSDIEARTQLMHAIAFGDLDSDAQMIRFDRKFLFPVNHLERLLVAIDHRYAVIDFNGSRVSEYESDYFDTSDWSLYRAHHNGAANRVKIRTRIYKNTGQSFFEIKQKNNKKLTTKKRRMLNPELDVLTDAKDFIAKHTGFKFEDLKPSLSTEYKRISLVNIRKHERLTIDYDLKFRIDNREVILPDLAIAEMKNDNRHMLTVFGKLMRENRIHPQSFSKYCVGMALLHPDVKTNNFKELIRELNPKYL